MWTSQCTTPLDLVLRGSQGSGCVDTVACSVAKFSGLVRVVPRPAKYSANFNEIQRIVTRKKENTSLPARRNWFVFKSGDGTGDSSDFLSPFCRLRTFLSKTITGYFSVKPKHASGVVHCQKEKQEKKERKKKILKQDKPKHKHKLSIWNAGTV